MNSATSDDNAPESAQLAKLPVEVTVVSQPLTKITTDFGSKRQCDSM